MEEFWQRFQTQIKSTREEGSSGSLQTGTLNTDRVLFFPDHRLACLSLLSVVRCVIMEVQFTPFAHLY